VSDADSVAESVLAIDIQGSLWILNIWDDEKQQIRGIHPQGRPAPESQMGWGVLSMPLSAFKQTLTPQESLGMLDIHSAFKAGALGRKMETFFDISKFNRGAKTPYSGQTVSRVRMTRYTCCILSHYAWHILSTPISITKQY
jgi:hypothetical protein